MRKLILVFVALLFSCSIEYSELISSNQSSLRKQTQISLTSSPSPIPTTSSKPSSPPEPSSTPDNPFHEPNTIKVKGQILNRENNQPIPHLKVEIKKVGSQLTNEKGIFTFERIPARKLLKLNIPFASENSIITNGNESIEDPFQIYVDCKKENTELKEGTIWGYVFDTNGQSVVNTTVKIKSVHPCVQFEQETISTTGNYVFRKVPLNIPIELTAISNNIVFQKVVTHSNEQHICSNMFHLGKPQDKERYSCTLRSLDFDDNKNPRLLLQNFKIIFTSELDDNSDIYIMDSDGSNQTQLTFSEGNDGGGQLSPEGSKVAFFTNRDNNYEIYTTNIDGSNQVNLTNNLKQDLIFSWSPDGSKIAFDSSRDTKSGLELYTMNSDGSNVKQLTKNGIFNSNPEWSPNGEKIVYTSGFSTTSHIWIMDADGSNKKQLTNSSFGFNASPKWSPDGKKIVFTYGHPSSNPDIYVINADGTNQLQLTKSEHSDSNPSWSPDSKKIAYDSGALTKDIFVVNANGIKSTRRKQLTIHSAEDFNPKWSPDGTRILFSSNRDENYEIYSVNIDGSNVKRLTNNPADDFLNQVQKTPEPTQNKVKQ